MIKNTICLDENYSTTRLVTQEKPEIINKPEDKFESVLFLPEGENRKGEGGLRTKGYFKKSFDDKPLISIITVVYNGEQFLEETILSVINQSYDNVEYIIIDGGSNDGTLDIIKKYENQIDYWLSEQDKGMYDALNKALQLSTGDIYGSLNSDDQYFKNTLEEVIYQYQHGHNVIFGKPCFLYDNGKMSCRKLFDITAFDLVAFKECTILPQPTSFISQQIAKEVGLFDLTYKVASDYEYLIRAVLVNEKAKYISTSFSIFRRHEEALTEKYAQLMHEEGLSIVNKYKDLCRFCFFREIFLKIRYIVKNHVVLVNYIKRKF